MTYGPLALVAVLTIFASLARYHCAIVAPVLAALDKAKTRARSSCKPSHAARRISATSGRVRP